MMEAPDSPPETSHTAAANSSQPSSSQQTNSNRVNGDGNAKVNHGPPGSSWTTKKFQEEYERANTQVLDQNWDSSEFIRFPEVLLG
jgi:hypothetical protein